MASSTSLAKTNASGELGPAYKLEFQSLPREIVAGLTEYQRYALGFASRVYKVVSARIQTFQTGSVSTGTLGFAGVQRSFGAHWGAFAGAGTINQSAVHQFQTDIQLKLTDEKTGHSTFIGRSLPFPITLALDPGDSVAIYYVVGGLKRHYQQGDFGMSQWTPFVGFLACLPPRQAILSFLEFCLLYLGFCVPQGSCLDHTALESSVF